MFVKCFSENSGATCYVMTLEAPEVSATKRKAEQVTRLLDIWEVVAVQAETARTGALRAAYAERYRRLVGVSPDQRQEFRKTLQHMHGITVEQLVQLFNNTHTPNAPVSVAGSELVVGVSLVT